MTRRKPRFETWNNRDVTVTRNRRGRFVTWHYTARPQRQAIPAMTVTTGRYGYRQRRRMYTYSRQERIQRIRQQDERQKQRSLETPRVTGEKQFTLYGKALTLEGDYDTRVEAHGRGKDLMKIVLKMKQDGYVPRRRNRYLRGRGDRILHDFDEYFTKGDLVNLEIESN